MSRNGALLTETHAGSRACAHLPYNYLPHTLFHKVAVGTPSSSLAPSSLWGALLGCHRHYQETQEPLYQGAGYPGSTRPSWLTISEKQNQRGPVGNRALHWGPAVGPSSSPATGTAGKKGALQRTQHPPSPGLAGTSEQGQSEAVTGPPGAHTQALT